MNKGLKTLLLIVGILGALYSVLTITNVFRRFKSPTVSGYPNIKRGASFYSSILKKPQRFNLICFYAELPNEGRQLIVKRLCGIPGDKVEIKKGILYVMIGMQIKILTCLIIISFPRRMQISSKPMKLLRMILLFQRMLVG